MWASARTKHNGGIMKIKYIGLDAINRAIGLYQNTARCFI